MTSLPLHLQRPHTVSHESDAALGTRAVLVGPIGGTTCPLIAGQSLPTAVVAPRSLEANPRVHVGATERVSQRIESRLSDELGNRQIPPFIGG